MATQKTATSATQDPTSPMVGGQAVAKTASPIYERYWFCEFLQDIEEAPTLHEMMWVFKRAVAELKQMLAAGVELNLDEGGRPDEILFTTDDPKVAKRFGFAKR